MGKGYAADSPQAICARDHLTLAGIQRDFFTNAITAPDQLRQRVAWALSQIAVTSGAERDLSYAYVMSRYQSIMFQEAFGNYQTLLCEDHAEPGHGQLSRHGQQRPWRWHPRGERELRAGNHAALLRRPGGTERRRHDDQGRPGAASDPDVRPEHHQGIRQGVHRLYVRRSGQSHGAGDQEERRVLRGEHGHVSDDGDFRPRNLGQDAAESASWCRPTRRRSRISMRRCRTCSCTRTHLRTSAAS